MLSHDFREFVGLLNAKRVKYLIVGGYALAAHGHPRYTGDLDVWLGVETANLQALLDALGEFGLGSLDLRIEDFLVPGGMVQLGYPPGRIDLLTDIDGVEFDTCYARRVVVTVANVQLPIINVEDFKANKRAAGRLKDLADLESLDDGSDGAL